MRSFCKEVGYYSQYMQSVDFNELKQKNRPAQEILKIRRVGCEQSVVDVGVGSSKSTLGRLKSFKSGHIGLLKCYC